MQLVSEKVKALNFKFLLISIKLYFMKNLYVFFVFLHEQRSSRLCVQLCLTSACNTAGWSFTFVAFAFQGSNTLHHLQTNFTLVLQLLLEGGKLLLSWNWRLDCRTTVVAYTFAAPTTVRAHTWSWSRDWDLTCRIYAIGGSSSRLFGSFWLCIDCGFRFLWHNWFLSKRLVYHLHVLGVTGSCHFYFFLFCRGNSGL